MYENDNYIGMVIKIEILLAIIFNFLSLSNGRGIFQQWQKNLTSMETGQE